MVKPQNGALKKRGKDKKAQGSKSKKGGDVKSKMDSLFAQAKVQKEKKKVEKAHNDEKKEAEKKLAEEAQTVLSGAETGKKRGRTDEGFAIYTMEELGLGKGGGTDKCPFDCDCCF